jgi:hypothetical protein
MRRLPGAVVALVLVLLTGVAGEAADPASLLPMFPEEFNAVAVVRVKEALATKRAEREGWRGEQSSDFLAGVIPPWVELLVRVSHIHPGETEDAQWSAALVESDKAATMAELAAAEKTTVETLRGTRVVKNQRGDYFVGFSDKLLGLFRPGHRQDTANWIDRVVAKKSTDLVGYLDAALKQTQGHIVLALDGRDLFEPSFIRFRVEGAKALQGKSPTEVDAVQRLFLGLQGVRSQVTISETIQWEVAIDFDVSVGNEAPLVQGVFTEFLEDMGLAIDELAGALVSTEGNAVVLRAELSDMSLRRIMTLITSPRAGSEKARKNPDRDYFRDLEKIVTDLQASSRKSGDPSRVAAWCDNYARKIESASTTGVDKLLVNYGQGLAGKLKALGASLRGMQLEVDVLQNSVTWNVHVQPGYVNAGWWGNVGFQPAVYNTTSNLQQVREKQAQAVLAGAKQRDDVWVMIENDRETVRKKLRAKYGAEMDTWK